MHFYLHYGYVMFILLNFFLENYSGTKIYRIYNLKMSTQNKSDMLWNKGTVGKAFSVMLRALYTFLKYALKRKHCNQEKNRLWVFGECRIYTLMSKIIFTYQKMMIFNEISNQCDPYLQGMCENQA